MAERRNISSKLKSAETDNRNRGHGDHHKKNIPLRDLLVKGALEKKREKWQLIHSGLEEFHRDSKRYLGAIDDFKDDIDQTNKDYERFTKDNALDNEDKRKLLDGCIESVKRLRGHVNTFKQARDDIYNDFLKAKTFGVN